MHTNLSKGRSVLKKNLCWQNLNCLVPKHYILYLTDILIVKTPNINLDSFGNLKPETLYCHSRILKFRMFLTLWCSWKFLTSWFWTDIWLDVCDSKFLLTWKKKYNFYLIVIVWLSYWTNLHLISHLLTSSGAVEVKKEILSIVCLWKSRSFPK